MKPQHFCVTPKGTLSLWGLLGRGGEGRRRQDQKRERFLSTGKRGDEGKDNKSDKSQRL